MERINMARHFYKGGKLATKTEDGLMKITFPFSHDTIQQVKELYGRKWVTEKKHWSAPINAKNIEILKGYDFIVTEAITNTLKEPQGIVHRAKKVPTLKRQLYPFQEQGVGFLEATKGRALIGDEMGLGKTIQALAYLELHPELRPAIIVCPASLKYNWAIEIEHTLTKPQHMILSGTKPSFVSAPIVILNYDILHAWLPALLKLKPKAVIADEAHVFRNSAAKRTKAVKRLSKAVNHFIALSGTPIVNRPIEFFNVLKILDTKNIIPDRWAYAQQYCGAKHNGFGWDFSGATNSKELYKLINGTFMIRRLKRNVLPELPDKIKTYIPMDLLNRKEYANAENDFINWLKESRGDEAAAKAEGAQTLVQIEVLKQIAVKGIMKSAISWIKDFLESGEKLIIFAVHKAVIKDLLDEFGDIAVSITGSVSQKGRQVAVDRFQQDSRVQLFVGNIQASGVGITLTAASNVLFLELPWSPGILSQAEDRAHRIGQKNAVNIYSMFAMDTIMEKVAIMLDEKTKVLTNVLEGTDPEKTTLFSELIKGYKSTALKI